MNAKKNTTHASGIQGCELLYYIWNGLLVGVNAKQGAIS